MLRPPFQWLFLLILCVCVCTRRPACVQHSEVSRLRSASQLPPVKAKGIYDSGRGTLESNLLCVLKVFIASVFAACNSFAYNYCIPTELFCRRRRYEHFAINSVEPFRNS